jgi:hypothetical protein
MSPETRDRFLAELGLLCRRYGVRLQAHDRSLDLYNVNWNLIAHHIEVESHAVTFCAPVSDNIRDEVAIPEGECG